MSKYVTTAEFAQWVDYYYREFSTRNRRDMLYIPFGNFGDNPKHRGVMVVSLRNGKSARSYCHPDDEWNLKTGLAVAYARYMGVEIPKVEKRYWIEKLIGKEVILPIECGAPPMTVFVTPYKKRGYTLVVDKLGYARMVHPNTYIPEHDIKQ